MQRAKWLHLRCTKRRKAKQQGPKREKVRARAILTTFSSFRKLARLMRQGNLPQERIGLIERAAINANKRLAS